MVGSGVSVAIDGFDAWIGVGGMPPTPLPRPPTPTPTLFAARLEQKPGRKRGRGRFSRADDGGLRFALYGRTSTGRFQDPASSREWQLDAATRAIAGVGGITVEFFDVGCSRSLPWRQRPCAAALLDKVARADRGFDAVVIGEFERAFDRGQARQVIAELHAFGVSVWLAEVDGPVELTDPAHQRW
jgi:hypothetical protein